MLCCFLHERKQNQAKELVGNTGLNHVFDTLDQEDGEQRHNNQGKDNGDETFRHGEFGLGHVFVTVEVQVLVGF